MSPPSPSGPTQGEIVREQVLKRGRLYFEDVQAEVRDRLLRLAPEGRKAFALACAERLISAHERRPPADRKPFPMSCRPALDAMWEGLAGRRVPETALKGLALLQSTASPDVDDDAAAASVYAIECFRTADPKPAGWASARAIEAAFAVAQKGLPRPEPDAWMASLTEEAAHPIVQDELKRQLDDLLALERGAATPDVLKALRDRARGG